MDLERSRHFRTFTDPLSGVKSYVLDTKVAKAQQGFYFVNPSMDDAGRYLWFYCYFPPASYHVLGVADFEDDEVRCFPDTQFMGGPLVDTDTGECIFGCAQGIFIKSPKADKPPVKLCDVPKELKNRGLLLSLATHLTFSPDKSEIYLDARAGDKFVHGSVRLSDGSFTLWKEFDYCRNHAQFNPADKDLVLIAEDFWSEVESGKAHVIRYNELGEFMRLWTLTRDGKETLYPPLDGERATHEWWSRDGRILYYCKYTTETLHTAAGVSGNNAIAGIDIKTGAHRVYAPVPAWHGFSSMRDEYFVYDENDVFYRGTPSRVGFYNAVSGKQVYIVSQNPALASPDRPSPYHLDPHPRFVCRDRYVCYTIAQNGYTEVALCETAPLIDMTM